MIVSSTSWPAARSASATVVDCVRARSEPRVPSRSVARALVSLSVRRRRSARRELFGERGLEPVQERVDRAVGTVVQEAA